MTRWLWWVVLFFVCCVRCGSAQDVTETRIAGVPAPPFVLNAPPSASLRTLQAGKLTATVENLGSADLTVSMSAGLSSAQPGAKPVALSLTVGGGQVQPPRQGTPGTTGGVRVTLAPRQVASVTVVKTTRGASGDTVTFTVGREGTPVYETSAAVPIQVPTVDFESSSPSLVGQWNLREIGGRLENAVLPLAAPVLLACGERVAGLLTSAYTSVQVSATPNPVGGATCPAGGSAPAQTVSLSVKPWGGTRLSTGTYEGTLKLGVDGGAATDRLKVKLLVGWPWGWAVVAVSLGVLLGFLYRLLGSRLIDIQADRTRAALYRRLAVAKAEDLAAKSALGKKYQGSFCKAAREEEREIGDALGSEQGLTRDPESAKAAATRLAVFQGAATEYERLIRALTDLRRSPPETPSFAERVAKLVDDPALAIPGLSDTRRTAETYVGLSGYWNSVEAQRKELEAGAVNARGRLSRVEAPSPPDPYLTALRSQVAYDLRRVAAVLGESRYLLDNADPAADTAKALRELLAKGVAALDAAEANLDILSPPKRSDVKELWRQDGQAPIGSSSPLPAVPPAEVRLREADGNLRHQRGLSLWLNFGFGVLSVFLVLLTGWNDLYAGKAFGWTEFGQAVAWGLGVKVSVDNLYLILDRLFSGGVRRTPSIA